MSKLAKVKLLLAAVIAAFVVAAANISLTIVERQAALREVSRYNLAWASSQAVNEMARLGYLLAVRAMPGSTVARDDVVLLLDILFNRLSLLGSGDMRALLDRYPEHRATIDEFAATLAAIEPLIDDLDRPGNVQRALARLAALDTRLQRLAATANQFGGSRVEEDQQQLLELHWQFVALVAALFACGLALIALLLWQNRLISRAHAAVNAMTGELTQARDAAQSANRGKSQFLATMSHELLTPLHSIIGFSEAIDQKLFGAIAPACYGEYVADILKSGRRMLDMVGDILTMSKLDAGHYRLDPQPVDVAVAIEATVRMFRGDDNAPQRDILVEACGDLPVLDADERAFRQMLLNLLSNAVKFSDAPAPVRVRCGRTAQGDLAVCVSDQGIGMTADAAALVVQPFYQADGSLQRRYEGTGLGLSIVDALMRLHGGRLEISSRPGKGSDLSLLFPAARLRADRQRKAA